MALSTASDFQDFLNRFMYAVDNCYGLDQYGLPIFAGILPEDWATQMATFLTYKQTRDAVASATELHPTSHGANQSVFA